MPLTSWVPTRSSALNKPSPLRSNTGLAWRAPLSRSKSITKPVRPARQGSLLGISVLNLTRRCTAPLGKVASLMTRSPAPGRSMRQPRSLGSKTLLLTKRKLPAGRSTPPSVTSLGLLVMVWARKWARTVLSAGVLAESKMP